MLWAPTSSFHSLPFLVAKHSYSQLSDNGDGNPAVPERSDIWSFVSSPFCIVVTPTHLAAYTYYI